MKLVEFVPPVKHPLWKLCLQMGITEVIVKVNPALTGLPDPWKFETLRKIVDGLAAEGLSVVGLEGDPFDMSPIKEFPGECDGQDARRPGDGAADGQDARRPSEVAVTGPTGVPPVGKEGCCAKSDGQDARRPSEAREEALEHYRELLESMARLGIRLLCYNFMVGSGWARTGVREIRGGAKATYFNNSEYEAMFRAPAAGATGVSPVGKEGCCAKSDGQDARRPDARRPSEARTTGATGVSPVAQSSSLLLDKSQVWANYEYFIKSVMPTAERVGVRMGLHPDDPCLPSLGGYARLFETVADFDRAYAIYPSPSNAVTFCQANFKLMLMATDGDIRCPGGDSTQVLVATARHFGKRIAYIHIRDVEGDKYDFTELFHDQGATDQFALMRTYRELGLDVPVRGDHVPEMEGDRKIVTDCVPGYFTLGRLFADGYLKALLKSAVAATLSLMTFAANAGLDIAPIDTGHDRNPSPLRVGMERIGTLTPRAANEISGSSWTLGCECLDRDFTDFDEYKDYIVPLGIREIRLFAGWAKCEREKGTFDFAWLDHCVDWAKANGIAVLLDISYGNPIYKGAGGAGLANGTPNTPEGLWAWDRWIEALGLHYRGRIRDYAMWNEPDNGGMNSPAVIADLNVRTARILKRLMPDCRLHGLSLGSNEPDLFEKCLGEIVKLGGQDLFDTYIYHGYARNPDSSYARVEQLIEICARLAPKAKMRQGENGCISEWSDRFALSLYPWSENSQAKWNMRRMLGDLGHGCRSSVYSICDLQYKGPYAPYEYLNRKGILRANRNHQVYQIKKAYYAVQNVVSVFDDSLECIAKPGISTIDKCVSLYEYRKDGRHPLFVFWDHGLTGQRRTFVDMDDGTGRMRKVAKFDKTRIPNGRMETDDQSYTFAHDTGREGTPSDDFTTRPGMLEWTGTPLKDPVWVDLFTGAVYAFPAKHQIVHSAGISFVRVPIYDSPCLLTERSALHLTALK